MARHASASLAVLDKCHVHAYARGENIGAKRRDQDDTGAEHADNFPSCVFALVERELACAVIRK